MAKAHDQNLPGKEAGLFRQVVKFYESKQYKKGIKAADQVGINAPSMSNELTRPYIVTHLAKLTILAQTALALQLMIRTHIETLISDAP